MCSEGLCYFYFRDAALTAKGHFERFTPAGDRIDREKAPFHQKEFGATFGGPLKKDRSFIFLSYERLDLRATNFVTIDDSTVIADPSGGPPIGTPAGILRRAGFPIETGHVPLSVRNTGVLGKADHRFTASQHLAVRANFADILDDTVEPWGVSSRRVAARWWTRSTMRSR